MTVLIIPFIKEYNPENLITILKTKTMGNLLYIIAVILIIAWAIGFIGYSVGGIIHILLVIAIIAIILRLIQGKRL
jgi:hypothetical protein